LPVSQLRGLLEVVLPLRTYTMGDVLALVAWVQRRNHQAYRAHRKRRQEGGERYGSQGVFRCKQFLS